MVAAAASAQAPPVAHALGGSLGSAIALLLFYPLERARIELQSEASQPAKSPTLNSIEKEAYGAPKMDTDEISPSPHTQGTSSESWVSLPHKANDESSERDEEIAKSLRPQSALLINPAMDPSLPGPIVTRSRKESLFECLVRLHQQKELYTGVSPVVSTIFTSQFIFFYLHAVVKKLLKQSSRETSHAAALSLLSSCLAGLGNVMLTNPLWVANMAIVTGETKSQNLWRELYVMIQKKGWPHMWSGTSASFLLVSNPVIQFFCYEQIRTARLASLKKSILPATEAFFIGAVAKAIATVTTYPLQLAQTLLRLENENKEKGILVCLRKIYLDGGACNLFRGLRAKLLQTVLTAAFTFLSYEQILGVVQAALISAVGIKSSL